VFEMKLGLSEDRKTASITLPGMTEPLQMNASEVEETIRHLAWFRSSMEPRIEPVDLKEETPISSVPAVRWQVTQDELPAQFRLFLLHPGFGWSYIPMDKASYDQMSAAARTFLEAPSSRQ